MTSLEFTNKFKNLNINNLNAKNYLKAWCLVCGTDDYAWGCIRAAQRLQWVNTIYDIIVVCPETLSKETFNLFKNNNINFKIVYDERLIKLYDNINNKYLESSNNILSIRGKSTIYNLILPLVLTEYKVLFILDCDKFCAKNIDFVLNFDLSENVTFGIADENNIMVSKTTNLNFTPYLGEYFCRPNKELFNIFLTRAIQTDQLCLEAFLGIYINETNNQQLYEFIDFNRSVVDSSLYHFAGALKPWTVKTLLTLYHYFTETSYIEFNTFMDANPELFEFLSLLFQSFNYGGSNPNSNNFKDSLLDFYDKNTTSDYWSKNILKMFESKQRALNRSK